MRLRIGVVALLVAALAPVQGVSADHADPTDCGDQPQMGAGWSQVVAHNVSCEKARRLAKTYTFEGEEEAEAIRPGNWDCRRLRRTGYESTRYRCRTGGERWVRFTIGS